MPSNDSSVGGLVLPIPAGTLNAPLLDAALAGIADFLRFMVKDALNAKIVNLKGTPSADAGDALPDANVFLYRPGETFVRNSFPALYVWWGKPSKRRPWTMLYDVRERVVSAMYVFDELVNPDGMAQRQGLCAAVDGAFYRAGEHGYHPNYQSGVPIYESVGFKGWCYEGGEEGFMMPIPYETEGAGLGESDGAIQRGYPAITGQFTVVERVTRLNHPSPSINDVPGTSPDANNSLDLSVYGTEDPSIDNATLIRENVIDT